MARLLFCLLFVSPLLASTYVYVTNAMGVGDERIDIPSFGSISIIDTSNNVLVATITPNQNPIGVALSPNGATLYVTLGTAPSESGDVTSVPRGTLEMINTSTNEVFGTVTVGTSPKFPALTPDGTRIFVPNNGSTSVSVVDVSTQAVIATVPVGSGPYSVAVTPDGTRAYVVNNLSSTVSVIDTASNMVTATIPVGSGPLEVVINPQGTYAYVTNYTDGTVSVIHLASGTTAMPITVGANPAGLSISPDGQTLYVANNMEDTISVIDTSTYMLENIDGISRPYGITVLSNGATAYVTSQDGGTVNVIDLSSNTIIKIITVGSDPIGIAATPALTGSSQRSRH